MLFIPSIVNATVICFICAELVAFFLGQASADQLLVGSILSGVLTFVSFKLSEEVRLHIDTDQDAPETKHGPDAGDA